MNEIIEQATNRKVLVESIKRLPEFPVFTPSELLAVELSDELPIISQSSKDIWYRGDPCLVLGGCGIGKSRWILTFAIADILGRSFCGFQTYGAGKWLIIGTENSVRRMQADLRRLIIGWNLNEIEVFKLDLNLKIVAFQSGFEIPPTNLDDPVAEKLISGLADTHKSDMVVIDPWEAFLSGGNSNEQGEVRRSFNTLNRIFRGSTLIIVHHAREGAINIKGATGYDASAFGKGAKNLTSMARHIFNLTPRFAPNEVSEKGHGIVIACGKSSNSQGFETRSVIFNDQKGTYEIEEDFDLEYYKADVDGKQRATLINLKELCKVVSEGVNQTKDIIQKYRDELNVNERTVRRALDKACKCRILERVGKGSYKLGEKKVEQ